MNRKSVIAPSSCRQTNFGLYRTDLDDDAYGVATAVSTGFFQNISATRRQGIETGLAYRDESGRPV